jgi:hypothetical protein
MQSGGERGRCVCGVVDLTNKSSGDVLQKIERVAGIQLSHHLRGGGEVSDAIGESNRLDRLDPSRPAHGSRCCSQWQ